MTREEALRALRSLVRDFSGINWTHLTYNPWSGCWKISDGCRFCYADASPEPRRRGAVWGKGNERKRASRTYLDQPHRWNEIAQVLGIRLRVFCGSMMDWAEDREDLDPWRLQLWRLIEQTPFLDWVLLTKRSARMLAWVREHGLPPNVVLGISVENQEAAEKRVPDLLEALRGRPNVGMISAEPLLGEVDLTCIAHLRDGVPGTLDALGGTWWPAVGDPDLEVEGLARVGWVVAGGESGEHARVWRPSWARKLRDDCATYQTPFLWKQHGEWSPANGGAGSDLYPEVEAAIRANPKIRGGLFNYDGVWEEVGVTPLRQSMIRLGKIRAGRHLDGTLHDAFPPGMSARDLSHLLHGASDAR